MKICINFAFREKYQKDIYKGLKTAYFISMSNNHFSETGLISLQIKIRKVSVCGSGLPISKCVGCFSPSGA